MVDRLSQVIIFLFVICLEFRDGRLNFRDSSMILGEFLPTVKKIESSCSPYVFRCSICFFISSVNCSSVSRWAASLLWWSRRSRMLGKAIEALWNPIGAKQNAFRPAIDALWKLIGAKQNALGKCNPSIVEANRGRAESI